MVIWNFIGLVIVIALEFLAVENSVHWSAHLINGIAIGVNFSALFVYALLEK